MSAAAGAAPALLLPLLLASSACMPSLPNAAVPMPPSAAVEPWEPELDHSGEPTSGPVAPSQYSPVADVFIWLVDEYREKIGPRSIRRCPFHETCSALARRALHDYGALGLLLVIDRYFYREHGAAAAHYARLRESDGTLRLDDALLPQR